MGSPCEGKQHEDNRYPKFANDALAATVAAEFGLSETRSLEVAKIAQAWNSAAGSCAMTDADADVFAQEILGVSISEAKAAYQSSVEGDTASMNALIDVAADTNGTSPEHVNKLIEKVFFGQN